LNAALPTLRGRQWYRALDTAQDAPADILERERQVPLATPAYQVNPRSVVVFEARA